MVSISQFLSVVNRTEHADRFRHDRCKQETRTSHGHALPHTLHFATGSWTQSGLSQHSCRMTAKTGERVAGPFFRVCRVIDVVCRATLYPSPAAYIELLKKIQGTCIVYHHTCVSNPECASADKAKKKKAQESQLLNTARKNLDLTVRWRRTHASLLRPASTYPIMHR